MIEVAGKELVEGRADRIREWALIATRFRIMAMLGMATNTPLSTPVTYLAAPTIQTMAIPDSTPPPPTTPSTTAPN